MCGRFTMHVSMDELKALFDLDHTPEDVPERYNIAPTQQVAVILPQGENERALEYLRWGLIPSWAKDPKIGSRMINARAETVAEKPSFRTALKKRRCLIIADGFYEWKTEGGKKVPMYIRLKSGEPFAFAGLWDVWQAPTGESLRTCTIITTAANETLGQFHHRMPVILPKENHDRWLDVNLHETAPLLELLNPYPADLMEAGPVSTKVNSAKNEGPELIEPA